MKKKIQSFLRSMLDIKNEPAISDNLTLKERVELFRNQLDYTTIVNPNYKLEELRYLSEPDIQTYLLKHQYNPNSVNEKERRLLVLKGIYFDISVPEELLLIDETLLGYYNYYQSLMNMELIDQSLIKKVSIKHVDFETKLLGYLAQVSNLYEKSKQNNNLLPIEFFTHYVYRFLNNHVVSDYDIVMLRYYMTAYAILFNKEIPEDYVMLNEDTHHNVEVLKGLLTNTLPNIPDPDKIKQSVLKVVK